MEKNEKTAGWIARFEAIAKKLRKLVPVELEEYTATTGEVLIIDGEPDTGAAVKVRNEAGEETAAPDGTYEINGRTITVAGGVISDVTAAPEAELNMEAVADSLEKVAEVVEGMAAERAEMSQRLEKNKSETEGRFSAIDENLKKVNATLEILGKKTTPETKTKKEEFAHESKLSFSQMVSMKNYK